MKNNTVLVTAYSKAPRETAMYENNKLMGVVVEVDLETHEIVDVEVTVMTILAKDFFKKLLIGINLVEELDEATDLLKNHYFTASTTALIVALKNVRQRYLDTRSKLEKFNEQ